MIDHMRRDATPTATTRAFEIVLSGDDFDADVADRYGWVDRNFSVAGAAEIMGEHLQNLVA